MPSSSNQMDRAMYAFYQATGSGVLCFDRDCNVISCHPARRNSSDPICLGIQKITLFLSRKYAEEFRKEQKIYTFFLELNLACNIVLIPRDGGWTGALVTTPVLLQRLADDEFDALILRMKLNTTDRTALKTALRKTPVVPYRKILPIGRMLSALAQSLFCEEARQVLYNGNDLFDRPDIKPNLEKRVDPLDDAQRRHGSLVTYHQLKDSIQKGNPQALMDILKSIDAGSVPMDQLQQSDFIRSLKDSCIKVCAMSSYMAVEGNAPYYKVMDLSDDLIRRIESLNSVTGLYELMQNALIAFAREVQVSHLTAYSRPVRQVLEYIEANYPEKITLDLLAKHTGLSPAYLSNLMKKETGQNLSAHINRIRVEHGKRLLLNSNLSSAQVAQRVGFCYQNHFAAIFKKITGSSPTEFRKRKN